MMFGSDAIVLIMIALTGLKIFIADIAANYCCRAVENLIIGDT